MGAVSTGAQWWLRRDSAVKIQISSPAPWLHGKQDGHGQHMDLRMAGAVPAVERGIPYGTAAHPSPPPKGMSVQLRVWRSLEHGSLGSGSAAAVAWCPCRGVSVF